MKDLHNWFETVDQLAISTAVFLELLCFALKEFEDSIGRLAFGKRILGVLGQVYSGLLAVVSQGCITKKFLGSLQKGKEM